MDSMLYQDDSDYLWTTQIRSRHALLVLALYITYPRNRACQWKNPLNQLWDLHADSEIAHAGDRGAGFPWRFGPAAKLGACPFRRMSV